MGRVFVILSILMVFLTVGCHQKTEEPTVSHTETVTASEHVYYVPNDDADFAKLVEKARETLPGFLTAAKEKSWGEGLYALKVGFPTHDGSAEHLWLQVTNIGDQDFAGTVQNKPVSATGVKLGDSRTLPYTQVTDWAYYHTDGTVRGAYTTPKHQGSAD